MSTINLSKQTINLSKGDKVNLSKQAEGLKKIMVGLGWDPVDKSDAQYVEETVQPGFLGRLFGAKEKTIRTRVDNRHAQDIDCDAWLALLEDGIYTESNSVVYYGNKQFYNDGELVILHHGDNLTGEGDGDDEQISIDLSKLPSRYNSIVVGVTIYQGKSRNQSFGSIKNTFIRVVDEKDNFEICRFNQADMAEDKDAITFIAGKLYKDKGEWQFTAIGKCTKDGSISDAVSHYKYK